MATMLTSIRTRQDCEDFLSASRYRLPDPEYAAKRGGMYVHARRKLGHNTWVEEWSNPKDGPRVFSVRYHDTYVVCYLPEGGIRLDTMGWMTTTTKDRLNECSPFSVWSEGTDPDGDVRWAVETLPHWAPRDEDGNPIHDAAAFQDGMTWKPNTGWGHHKEMVFNRTRWRMKQLEAMRQVQVDAARSWDTRQREIAAEAAEAAETARRLARWSPEVVDMFDDGED